jgi:hypothetical protein
MRSLNDEPTLITTICSAYSDAWEMHQKLSFPMSGLRSGLPMSGLKISPDARFYTIAPMLPPEGAALGNGCQMVVILVISIETHSLICIGRSLAPWVHKRVRPFGDRQR